MKTDKKTVEKAPGLHSFSPKTSLGKKLLEARAKIVASGRDLLDWEGIGKEVCDGRGGHETRTR